MKSSKRFCTCLALGALAFGVSVYSAPRVDAQGKGKVRSDVSRVTGANGQLSLAQGDVAGAFGGYFRFDAGTVGGGNTVTSDGGENVTMEVALGGWGGIPLKTWQVTVDAVGGFVNGVGCDLGWAVQPCATPGADPICTAFGKGSVCIGRCLGEAGEPGCSFDFECTDGTCDPTVCVPGFQDTTRKFPHPTGVAAVDTSGMNFRFGSNLGAGAPCVDTGNTFYGGAGVIEVPCCAAGDYTIGFIIGGGTFMELFNGTTYNVPDQGGTVTPLTISVPTGQCCLGQDCAWDDQSKCMCDDKGGTFNADKTCADDCACTAHTQCADGDACTQDICDFGTGICSNPVIPTWNQATQCCDTVAGVTGLIDDGVQCTTDYCDDGGNRGHAIHDPEADTVACEGPNPCYYGYHCDGVNIGDDACIGYDVNEVECPIGDECDGLPGEGCVDGYCSCSINPNLAINITPGDYPKNPNCFDDDDKIVATIHVGPAVAPITGGRFLIQYDPACMIFNDLILIDPFLLNLGGVSEPLGPGMLSFSVMVELGATPPAGGNFDIAALSFIKTGECAACDLCPLVGDEEYNPYHTVLDQGGKELEVVPKCSKEIKGNGELTMDVPETVKYNVDCDGKTKVVTWDPPTADDTCGLQNFDCWMEWQNPYTQEVIDGGDLNGDGVEDVSPMGGGEFPVGIANFYCAAENDCGALVEDAWTVQINDETTLDVVVQLSPRLNITDPKQELERCIKFELWADTIQDPVIFQETLVFGGIFEILGHHTGTIKVPAMGQWECITARDQLHTLRACTMLECVDGVLSAVFKGDPWYGGNWLIGGNLDGWQKKNPGVSHNVIDIVDFGTLLSQWLTALDPDTPCDLKVDGQFEGPHADINGDGFVDLLDFTFISMNFMVSSKACCDPTYPGAIETGRTSITVDELRQFGLGDLSVADLNGDGVVDTDDMEALIRGEAPTRKAPRRSGAGLR